MRVGEQVKRVCCVLACWATVALAVADEPMPLHQRIDAVIDAARLGTEPDVCQDAEFLRRVSLDLAGVIPTSAEARAFLNDPAPGKRAALIDRLLADPRFARRLQVVLDLLFMERRPAKHVTQPEWSEYLLTSLQQNKPLNQLAREILAADGTNTDGKQRPAARFYLDRDGEKTLLTRDVARVFLGRDVACSQCHDHPLIGDYLQWDYYGLFAFLNRSLLFTDAKEKKTYFAENAEGELVDFKSVFTGEARKTGPHLPGRPTFDEPQFDKGQEYVVAPAKDVRPVPKYSRRDLLAKELTSGQFRPFPRNLANRLWGVLFGRGVVHPYDVDHAQNPPSHPELLELLTDELVGMNFDAKRFLRELALTKAYQRGRFVPETPLPDKPAIEKRLADAQAAKDQLTASLDPIRKEFEPCDEALKTIAATVTTAAAEAAKGEAPLRDAEKKHVERIAALQTAKQAVEKKSAAQKTLGELAAAAKLAQAKFPDEKVIADSAAQLTARADQLNTELAAANKIVADQTAQLDIAAQQVTAAKDALAKASQPYRDALKSQQAAEEKKLAVRQRHDVILRQIAVHNQLLEDGKSLLAFHAAKEQTTLAPPADPPVATTPPDSAAAETALGPLAERWTKRFFIATVEPLSPEQLSLSVLQAAGLLETFRASAETAEKDKAAKANQTVEPAELARRVEAATFAKALPELNVFVGILSSGTGPTAHDYQSTVQEALFFANGAKVTPWLKPQTGNLADRLAKLTEPAALADELYLSVLTRRPSPEEITAVTQHLTGRDADRPVAIEELTWGLLCSAEFRFDH